MARPSSARAPYAARIARAAEEKKLVEACLDVGEQIDGLYSAAVNALTGMNKDWRVPSQVEAYLTSMAALAVSVSEIAAQAEASYSPECARICRAMSEAVELRRQEALAHVEVCKAVAAYGAYMDGERRGAKAC